MPVPTLCTRPFNTSPGITSSTIATVAGLDVAEVVLGHVGADPEVVNGDQGHRRRADLRILPDIGAQIGHRTAGGSDHLSALEIQLGLLDRRARTQQLRVSFAASPAVSWARRRSASALFS